MMVSAVTLGGCCAPHVRFSRCSALGAHSSSPPDGRSMLAAQAITCHVVYPAHTWMLHVWICALSALQQATHTFAWVQGVLQPAHPDAGWRHFHPSRPRPHKHHLPHTFAPLSGFQDVPCAICTLGWQCPDTCFRRSGLSDGLHLDTCRHQPQRCRSVSTAPSCLSFAVFHVPPPPSLRRAPGCVPPVHPRLPVRSHPPGAAAVGPGNCLRTPQRAGGPCSSSGGGGAGWWWDGGVVLCGVDGAGEGEGALQQFPRPPVAYCSAYIQWHTMAVPRAVTVAYSGNSKGLNRSGGAMEMPVSFQGRFQEGEGRCTDFVTTHGVAFSQLHVPLFHHHVPFRCCRGLFKGPGVWDRTPSTAVGRPASAQVLLYWVHPAHSCWIPNPQPFNVPPMLPPTPLSTSPIFSAVHPLHHQVLGAPRPPDAPQAGPGAPPAAAGVWRTQPSAPRGHQHPGGTGGGGGRREWPGQLW
jgi:hypothetical protein